MLSSKTGSDVGGLYNQGFEVEVHHFEMKPLLGKDSLTYIIYRNITILRPRKKNERKNCALLNMLKYS